MMVKNINISDIIVNNRYRKIDEAFVKNLAKSIKEDGLINPIFVTQDNILVAGNHRLEAYKLNNQNTIPCNVAQFKLTNEDKIIMEMSENIIRNDIKKSDKHKLYIELRSYRDARKNNSGTKGTGTRCLDVTSNGVTSNLSRNETYKKSKELRNDDAKEVGFRNLSEQIKVGTVTNQGIDEVIAAMDNEEITVTGANMITRLDKEDQKEALDKKLNNTKVEPDLKISKHEEKIIKLQERDKYGSYIEIKCYTSEPKRTAINLAKQFGSVRIDAFRVLLVEMNRQLKMMNSINVAPIEPNAYKNYSYGLTSISDGEFDEISELLKINIMTKKSICDEYEIGTQTLSKIIKIIKDIKQEE